MIWCISLHRCPGKIPVPASVVLPIASKNSCNFPDKLKKLFGFDHLGMECTSSLNSINDDNDHYNKSWQIQLQRVSSTDEWSYQSAWDLESVPYLGERAIYVGGGYLVDMNAGPSAILKISELMHKSWIDTRTRAFFIEFVLYNPNVNMYSSVMIVFEYSNPDYDNAETINKNNQCALEGNKYPTDI
ncbi:PKD1L2 [Mytilus coruscus]|uniref:PKD1L2 n=1 Tax=Mytilus coruscus TaxID=42192 RepID=A0A6J8DFF8_MYTCO|nr:PKD1L2 [Mytilus coruscus]